MTKIGVILGSTKPGRNGEAVAKWVYDIAKQREDEVHSMLDQIIAWADALKPLR